jgi:hypothetical protein
VKRRARRDRFWESFVTSELRRSLDLVILASNERIGGNAAAASREELVAQRAYQEALHLSTVLRPQISKAGVRRLAITIQQIRDAMDNA